MASKRRGSREKRQVKKGAIKEAIKIQNNKGIRELNIWKAKSIKMRDQGGGVCEGWLVSYLVSRERRVSECE